MHQVQLQHYETILSFSAFYQVGSLLKSQRVKLASFGEVLATLHYLSLQAHSQSSLIHIVDAFQFEWLILQLVMR